jgi:hypothetical protein
MSMGLATSAPLPSLTFADMAMLSLAQQKGLTMGDFRPRKGVSATVACCRERGARFVLTDLLRPSLSVEQRWSSLCLVSERRIHPGNLATPVPLSSCLGWLLWIILRRSPERGATVITEEAGRHLPEVWVAVSLRTIQATPTATTPTPTTSASPLLTRHWPNAASSTTMRSREASPWQRSQATLWPFKRVLSRRDTEASLPIYFKPSVRMVIRRVTR